MPALITHHLFGEESIDRLPQGVITSDEERIAFILGNQGPDPFFFHILTCLLYTSPSPRDVEESRMPSSA